jgi:hypothetical protein
LDDLPKKKEQPKEPANLLQQSAINIEFWYICYIWLILWFWFLLIKKQNLA